MPIQFTGARINVEHEELLKLALEFQSLTRQAKEEKSHDYAEKPAEQIASFLFTLSMATDDQVSDYKIGGALITNKDLCVSLGTEAHRTRDHNWVQSICFAAIACLQRLMARY